MSDSKQDKSIKELLAEVVAASGFPFQAKIQAVIESRKDWKVLGAEMPWRYEGEEDFIDIVAYRGNIHLVIECKKAATIPSPKSKHGKQWPSGTRRVNYVFLRRETKSDTAQETTRTLVTYCPDENDTELDSQVVFGAQPQEWNFAPASVEASLCITIDVEEPRALVERDVAKLVRGCHEFANAVYADASRYGAPTREIYIPVLVTTAHLFVAAFKPDDVDIADGGYNLDAKGIEPVPWVRFRKAFMAGGAEHSDVRTVLVVQSASFEDFLDKFDVTSDPKAVMSD